jgi:hypothetical protein
VSCRPQGEGAILNLWRAASAHCGPDVNECADVEWTTLGAYQVARKSAPKDRSDVLERMRVEASDAYVAWLHACEVIDDYAHE